MIKQTPGKIYLADQRGVVESSQFRRQSTFNFGAYQQAHKEPFGRLRGLNEETLAGGYEVAAVTEHDIYLVLLPITGAVEFSTSQGTTVTVEAEEVLTIALPAGSTLRLRNPYATELISFLHLWVQAAVPPALPIEEASWLTTFSAGLLENQLHELVGLQPKGLALLPFRLSLGRFMGRYEAVYRPAAGNQLFAFVLAGAFELEGRLLHEKDGVALWDVEEIELEALSNQALVLVLELVP